RVGIGEGNKAPHTLQVRTVLGREVHAISRRVQRGEDVIKMDMSIRRPHTNRLRKLQPSLAPSFWWIPDGVIGAQSNGPGAAENGRFGACWLDDKGARPR